ncbi:MAG: hypothetical protein LBR26_14950, partial [Prevotella sp.]|nr:hypothetical protein [Prevotella sp.]
CRRESLPENFARKCDALPIACNLRSSVRSASSACKNNAPAKRNGRFDCVDFGSVDFQFNSNIIRKGYRAINSSSP